MDKPVEPVNAVPWWVSAWLPGGGGASRQFNQPILPGWSLISVTEQNSSRPETECAIVAEESYGRQIGKLTAAVLALIAARPVEADLPDAFVELEQLSERIEAIKCDAAERRVAALRDDLAALKRSRPDIYAKRVAELRAALSD
jgi:hypothetical protein